MSSHENKTFRSRSVVKQKGMVFGFRESATAVTRPEMSIEIHFSDKACIGFFRLSKESIAEKRLRVSA